MTALHRSRFGPWTIKAFHIGTILEWNNPDEVIGPNPKAFRYLREHGLHASHYAQTARNVLLPLLTGKEAMQRVKKSPPESEFQQRDAILLERLPLVKFIARRIHERLPQHIDIQDLIHAGILGLLDALKKYDHSRNVQFKSYAQFRIRGDILDSLRELDWSPRLLRSRARRIEEAQSRLTSGLGRAATEGELAREVGLDLKSFQRLSRELRGLEILSIEGEAAADDFYPQKLTSTLVDHSLENPYELCAKSEMSQIVLQALLELPKREGQMLLLYYFEELTMKEIGVLFGVVESRVSQMHTSVMLHLRLRLAGALRRVSGNPAKSGHPGHGLRELFAQVALNA